MPSALSRKDSKVLVDLQAVATQLNDSVDQQSGKVALVLPCDPVSVLQTSSKISVDERREEDDESEKSEKSGKSGKEEESEDDATTRKRRREGGLRVLPPNEEEKTVAKTLAMFQSLLVDADSISTHELLSSGVVLTPINERPRPDTLPSCGQSFLVGTGTILVSLFLFLSKYISKSFNTCSEILSSPPPPPAVV